MTVVDTSKRLQQLRSQMKENHMAAYYVPSEDAHQSEYIAPCDARRAFISGFTGSAGCAIITEKKAGLWTDGRYFLQAEKELDGNWELIKMGTPNVPTKEQWIVDNLQEHDVVGVDPTLVSFELFKKWEAVFSKKGIQWKLYTPNLVDLVWGKARPSLPQGRLMALDTQYSGETFASKVTRVREELKKSQLGGFVFSALDDIAWCLNWRGSDIPYNPVFLSYLWIDDTRVTVYLDEQKLTPELRDTLNGDNESKVFFKPYSEIFPDLKRWHESTKDIKLGLSSHASYALVYYAGGEERVKLMSSPIVQLKAIKNTTEQEGIRQCHLRDGAALCQYFAWLDDQLNTQGNTSISEVDGADKLESFRSRQPLFMGLSFSTISSVGPNAAIIHYKPERGSDAIINKNEVYLCDSGGQYLNGTTDVTRTLHFGQPSPAEKKMYTLVLKGQLALGSLVFPEKTSGYKVDVLARQFLWSEGLDYRHGTGHGVGHFLNVHEGPQEISYRIDSTNISLVKGMVLSNEPGYYEDGKYGFRLENLMMVKMLHMKSPTFANAPYFGFETVTMVPFQRTLMDFSLLSKVEVGLVNAYHSLVYANLSPLLQDDPLALAWLKRETEEIRMYSSC